MNVKDTMIEKLTAAFAPSELAVVDESQLHAGHAGWREGGETHFRVRVVSAAFRDKSRVERHRQVHAVLAAELAGSVHALALSLDAPAASEDK
jgi:BolA protein